MRAPNGDSLIVATNREPYRLRKSGQEELLEQTTGGLVSALVPAVEAARGVWVAWNPGSRLELERLGHRLGHELSLIPISEKEIAGYYRGFSNGALWPLCHYAIDRCRFNANDWQKYVSVNRRFSERIAAQGRRSATVWVNDYHLMLVPALLRAQPEFAGRIGYFHHIPFPSAAVFRVLPWRRDVLRGLLGADVLGFHTREYVTNFLDACRELPEATVGEGKVQLNGRTVEVGDHPIGIDAGEFDRLGRDPRVRRDAAAIRRNLGTETILLGVDRLDYTKGIPQRLEAIDRLLTKWPRLKGRVSLIQIAVPSRSEIPEYSRFKKHIDELIGRINGKHAEDGWQPIHCIYRGVSRRKLAAHYIAADIALVTPLRDGMNLVAKEFCAARADEDGVLVLSEFAGVADELGSSARLVNPFDADGFAQTIAAATTLERADRRARMQTMRRLVMQNDVYGWSRRFLDHVGCAQAAEAGLA